MFDPHAPDRWVWHEIVVPPSTDDSFELLARLAARDPAIADVEQATELALRSHIVQHRLFSGDYVIYRARRHEREEPFSNALDMWGPLVRNITKIGRFNDAHDARLYCSNNPNSALFETRPQPGWRVSIVVAAPVDPARVLKLAPIGMSGFVGPPEIGVDENFTISAATREQLRQSGNLPIWQAQNDFIREAVSYLPPPADEHEAYRRSLAVGKWADRLGGAEGLIYPSIASARCGLNYCIPSRIADELFYPIEAWDVRVGLDCTYDPAQEGRPSELSLEIERVSNDIDINGNIAWSGRARFHWMQLYEAHHRLVSGIHVRNATVSFAELRQRLCRQLDV